MSAIPSTLCFTHSKWSKKAIVLIIFIILISFLDANLFEGEISLYSKHQRTFLVKGQPIFQVFQVAYISIAYCEITERNIYWPLPPSLLPNLVPGTEFLKPF